MMDCTKKNGNGTTLLACGIALLAAGVVQAQQTIYVGGGSGLPSIPAALAVAQPGDVVVVRQGVWPANFAVDKGITLIGEDAVLTRGSFGPWRIDITNVPAGQAFVLRGFDTDAAAASDLDIVIADCAGRVSLQELGMNGLIAWRVGATNVAQLHVGGLVSRSFGAVDCSSVIERLIHDPGLLGVSIVRGRASFDSCSLNGPSSGLVAPALSLQDAQVAVSRCTLMAPSPFAPVIIAQSGVLLLDPSASLLPSPGQALITGGAAVATLELSTLTTRMDDQDLTINNQGRAGELFVTVLALPGPQLATPLGVTWLDPTALSIVAFGTFGASRQQVDTINFAGLPVVPQGLTVALQSIVFGPGGHIGLGSPSLVTRS